MTEFLYTNGWGAFVIMLLLQIPFLIIFFRIINKKAFIDNTPSKLETSKYSQIEILWIIVVIVAFISINVASIKYMPTVIAKAKMSLSDVKDVNVTARMWSYEISDRQYQVGQPIRFLAKSADTTHSFAIYDPKGKILFTMMLLPGVSEPSSLIYTFDEPGEYTVRCMEYCGIAHHAMKNTITVVSKE